MALKLKQIKNRALQEEYYDAGLLYYDFEPLNVAWKGGYWIKKEACYTSPHLAEGFEILPPDYMYFIAVED